MWYSNLEHKILEDRETRIVKSEYRVGNNSDSILNRLKLDKVSKKRSRKEWTVIKDNSKNRTTLGRIESKTMKRARVSL